MVTYSFQSISLKCRRGLAMSSKLPSASSSVKASVLKHITTSYQCSVHNTWYVSFTRHYQLFTNQSFMMLNKCSIQIYSKISWSLPTSHSLTDEMTIKVT